MSNENEKILTEEELNEVTGGAAKKQPVPQPKKQDPKAQKKQPAPQPQPQPKQPQKQEPQKTVQPQKLNAKR